MQPKAVVRVHIIPDNDHRELIVEKFQNGEYDRELTKAEHSAIRTAIEFKAVITMGKICVQYFSGESKKPHPS